MSSSEETKKAERYGATAADLGYVGIIPASAVLLASAYRPDTEATNMAWRYGNKIIITRTRSLGGDGGPETACVVASHDVFDGSMHDINEETDSVAFLCKDKARNFCLKTISLRGNGLFIMRAVPWLNSPDMPEGRILASAVVDGKVHVAVKRGTRVHVYEDGAFQLMSSEAHHAKSGERATVFGLASLVGIGELFVGTRRRAASAQYHCPAREHAALPGYESDLDDNAVFLGSINPNALGREVRFWDNNGSVAVSVVNADGITVSGTRIPNRFHCTPEIDTERKTLAILWPNHNARKTNGQPALAVGYYGYGGEAPSSRLLPWLDKIDNDRIIKSAIVRGHAVVAYESKDKTLVHVTFEGKPIGSHGKSYFDLVDLKGIADAISDEQLDSIEARMLDADDGTTDGTAADSKLPELDHIGRVTQDGAWTLADPIPEDALCVLLDSNGSLFMHEETGELFFRDKNNRLAWHDLFDTEYGVAVDGPRFRYKEKNRNIELTIDLAVLVRDIDARLSTDKRDPGRLASVHTRGKWFDLVAGAYSSMGCLSSVADGTITVSESHIAARNDCAVLLKGGSRQDFASPLRVPVLLEERKPIGVVISRTTLAGEKLPQDENKPLGETLYYSRGLRVSSTGRFFYHKSIPPESEVTIVSSRPETTDDSPYLGVVSVGDSEKAYTIADNSSGNPETDTLQANKTERVIAMNIDDDLRAKPNHAKSNEPESPTLRAEAIDGIELGVAGVALKLAQERLLRLTEGLQAPLPAKILLQQALASSLGLAAIGFGVRAVLPVVADRLPEAARPWARLGAHVAAVRSFQALTEGFGGAVIEQITAFAKDYENAAKALGAPSSFSVDFGAKSKAEVATK